MRVTKEQFVKDMTAEQAKRRKKKEDQVLGYFKETHLDRKRKWSVKMGGHRY